MILRKVTRTALRQHYTRGHLTLTEYHFNSTEELKTWFNCWIKSTQWCLNQQVILAFKHHYASVILVTLWRTIMILLWTEIFLCVVAPWSYKVLSINPFCGKMMVRFAEIWSSIMLKNHQIVTISWPKAQNDNSISAFDWVGHKHRLGLLNMYKIIIPMLISPIKDHVSIIS